MKRFFAAVMILSLAFGLCGCNTKSISVQQSQKNFAVYQKSLEKIADKYKLKLTEKKKDICDEQTEKDFGISENSKACISIFLVNSTIESYPGVEGVTIDYKIASIRSESEYNLPLFVDVVNCVSGKEISVDTCNEFLKAPESKYSSEKNGYKKINGEIIAKQQALNFFEDWNIFYVLNNDGEGVLTFAGLTKQLTK